jgi:hypothetical protein
MGFFDVGSFYPRPTHSSSFCHQLLSFGSVGVLGIAAGCGLFGFGVVVIGVALAGVPELPFEADDCGAGAVADVSVEGVDSSTAGGVEK